MNRILSRLLILSFSVSILSLQSCFTGVESTGKINLTKKELNAVAPSKEDLFLSDVAPLPLGEWKKGKRFIVADEKLRLVIDGTPAVNPHKNDTLYFESVNSRPGVGGGERILINFRLLSDEIAYPVEKNLDASMNGLTVSELPMIIDLDLVESVREKLAGMLLWTKSALWYSDSLEYKKGKKFYPVKVLDVEPGNAFFPLLVKFTTDGNDTGSFMMNIGNSGNESRNFGKLFSLSDPKNSYKNISEENWQAIQNEEVRIGMTKEECRLAIGNPDDVDFGHNYSNSMEIWYYPNGRYLRFIDGLLIGGK